MKKNELIFISYSKHYTAKVAGLFDTLLKHLYSNKDVEMFFAQKSLMAGDHFDQVIETKLAKAKCGISFLTPENKELSPWLMYEAGALTIKVKENKGSFLPFLFCLPRAEFIGPLQTIHFKEYQPSDHNNLNDLIDFFKAINLTLSETNRLKNSEINDFIVAQWTDYLKNELASLAARMKDSSISGDGSHSSQSGINDSVSLQALNTEDQDTIGLLDDFTPKTPNEIDEQFEKILNNQVSSKWWKIQNDDEIKFNIHRVMVNSTRFSTFVVFTDGERVVLFDRAKDSPNTNVHNDRFDVFGSVQFENRTIKIKIKSQEFLNSPIKRITEIPGIAVEDNSLNKADMLNETVVMLGVCVYMESKYLNLAVRDTLNNEICIYNLKKLISFKPYVLTSKASLSINYLLKQDTLSS